MRNNLTRIPEAFSLLDYFTPSEIADSYWFLVPKNFTREALFNAIVTKPQIHSSKALAFLGVYYSASSKGTVKNRNKIEQLLKANYYQLVSYQTVEELLNATNLIFSYRDPVKEANLPPICLVTVKDYFPTGTDSLLLNLITKRN